MWKNTKRPEFLNNKFWIQNVKEDNTTTTSDSTLNMRTDESVEHQLDEDRYGELPHYDPLYYSLRDDASKFGVSKINFFRFTDTLKFNVLVGEGKTQQTVSLPPFQLYEVRQQRTNSIG
jgi:hypothetical protein